MVGIVPGGEIPHHALVADEEDVARRDPAGARPGRDGIGQDAAHTEDRGETADIERQRGGTRIGVAGLGDEGEGQGTHHGDIPDREGPLGMSFERQIAGNVVVVAQDAGHDEERRDRQAEIEVVVLVGAVAEDRSGQHGDGEDHDDVARRRGRRKRRAQDCGIGLAAAPACRWRAEHPAGHGKFRDASGQGNGTNHVDPPQNETVPAENDMLGRVWGEGRNRCAPRGGVLMGWRLVVPALTGLKLLRNTAARDVPCDTRPGREPGDRHESHAHPDEFDQ